MKVGIVGTGAIGFPIAERIVKRGHELCFYARRQDVIAQLENLGAKFVCLRDMGKSCNVILLFLKTYEQCLECITEIMITMKKGVVAVGSTISPEEMCHLNNICAQSGIETVAIPVTGGVKGAKDGKLTIIASGNRARIYHLEPVFSSFGTINFISEEIKTAHIMKLLVQLLVGINTVAMAEAFTLGIKSGLDPHLIYDTICQSAGTTRIFENRGEAVISRNFEKRGTVDILYKDLQYCAELGSKSRCPIPIGQLCFNIFQIGACVLNDTQEDFSAIVQLYEQWSETVIEDTAELLE